MKELINSEVEPRHLSINIKVQPTHIAINCDHEWLAIIGGQMLIVYKVTDFQNSVSISLLNNFLNFAPECKIIFV